jgi:hypothetical protein
MKNQPGQRLFSHKIGEEMLRKILVSLIILSSFSLASEHGIYLQLLKNVDGNIDQVGNVISGKLQNAGFQIILFRDVATPDIVRDQTADECGFKAKEILFTSDAYRDFLTSYGNKYLSAVLLRLAIYQNEKGIQVNIVDPATINMIVFNDLYENDEEAKYNEVKSKTDVYRNKIIEAVHSAGLGENVQKPLPPIRDDEDIAESSKDMFMMVGELTFFNDEDQFPVIYKEKAGDVVSQIKKLVDRIKSNLENDKPSKDDYEYRLTKNPDVLKWQIVAEIYSSDKSAAFLGITRPRTEGLSMDIAGHSRETDMNKCPGLDHAGAFPIEVVIYKDGNNLVVRTAREMFRMDMFFWDAGMKAFMDHMSMPKILDASLKQAMFREK